VITFIKEIKLLKDENTNWIGSKNLNSDGGYLNHGSCATNGIHFVWHSRKNYHVFNL